MKMLVASALLVLLQLEQAPAKAADPLADVSLSAQKVDRLQASPSEIHITGRNRRQQLVMTAFGRDSQAFDVSHRCEITVANQSVAKAVDGVVFGVADGKTELTLRCGAARLTVPVVVDGISTFPPIHFVNDVIPLFSKLGCNSSNCHGKQGGQNGFRLSVFGFDARADYNTLVKDARGRRVFPGSPERSLLVSKAVGRVAHGGGRRAKAGSGDHALLAEWVRQGMPWGDDDAAHVVSIRVEPADRVMRMKSDQQLQVTAVYSDGGVRDVTAAADYTSNSVTIAAADERGRIRTGDLPGEAAVTVNYMGHVGVMRVLIPRPQFPSPYPQLPSNNVIDGFVWTKLKKMGIVPSGLCDDATFLRRASLDTIGTLPTADEVRTFLAEKSKGKRQRKIDELLVRNEFADFWALKWADVLLVDRDTLGDRGAYEFHRWLRARMASNTPYNEWVAELLTASGNSGKNGPVNFFRALREPEQLTRAVSQAFLGVRIDCAQCHHHPFEKWAQKDFYGMAGFFNGLERKSISANRELVFHAGYQTTKLPLTGEVVPTRPPDGDVLPDADSGDPRTHLAKWMTARDNPWFARLAANRLWKHFLGRGLVEPEDDFRSTNPATNEPLLSFLSAQLVDGGFDMKAVMRLILNSRVYQLSSKPNETNRDDHQNYSHYLVKRLPAEVLLDAICEVTGTPEDYAGLPRGTRAIQLWDNRLPSYFLDTFGRSERKSPCECAKSSAPTMSQALHLMNAPEIEAKISHPTGRVAGLIASGRTQAEIVEELSLSALGRSPSQKERTVAARLFGDEVSQQAAEDFLWTLLNSYDFLFIR